MVRFSELAHNKLVFSCSRALLPSNYQHHYHHFASTTAFLPIIMSESSLALSILDSTMSQTNSTTSTINAFDRMRTGVANTRTTAQRDTCKRLTPQYNDNYNPYKPSPADLPASYSPYKSGEPLFDDRPCVVAQLKPHHTLAPAPKRVRLQWTWALGYAIYNNSRAAAKMETPLLWMCKLCMLVLLIYVLY